MQEYTDIDLELIKSAVSMTLTGGSSALYSKVFSFRSLDDFNPSGLVINFQFPPRITGDSKRAEWKEIPIASYEPLAYWMGADARKISLQFEYIVTARSNAGTSKWAINYINDQLKKLKSYFYTTVTQGIDKYPLVRLNLYDYSPKAESGTERLGTWRMFDIDIKPDGPILLDGSNSFHLKHVVTTNLALVTANNTASGTTTSGAVDTNKIEKDKQNVSNLFPNGAVISKWF